MDLMSMLKEYFDEKQIKALADKLGESSSTITKAVETMFDAVQPQ